VRAVDGPVALVGHSTGGLAALLAAARLASEVKLEKLLLLSPAAPAGVNAFTWANLPVFLPAVLGGGRALPSPARYTALFMNRQDRDLRRRIYPRLVAEPRAFIREVALPWLHPHGAAQLRFGEAPSFATRILVGAGDRSTPPRVQRDLAARIPGAELELLDAPDHYGMIEGVGGGAVLARALDFLGD
jgi:pimeloyl-ACP methyl ester carboxylesterase